MEITAAYKGKRIEYFDIAKGIGMLAIIAGHFGLSKVDGFVYTFHVPLFFLISGYFFRDKSSFIRLHARQLLMPYFITAAVVAILVTFAQPVQYMLGMIDEYSISSTFFQYMFVTIYGNGSAFGNVQCYIGAIWFLLALFWGQIFLRLIMKINGVMAQSFIAGVLSVAGSISAGYVWLPFSIQSGMVAVIFMLMGRYIAKYGMTKLLQNRTLIAVCFVMWMTSIMFSYYHGIMSIVQARFPNVAIDILGGEQALL